MTRALIVGIDKYDTLPRLTGCVNDAREMRKALESHEDGSNNYDCRLLISPGTQGITRKRLREEWSAFFDNYGGDILFYFSGHGHTTDVDGYIVTQDAEPGDPGLGMTELLTLANKSKAKTVLLILDCCFGGGLGSPSLLQGGWIENLALLREGLTILTASRATQTAAEAEGHGIFTSLVVGALNGGAADVRGHVYVPSIYAYVEQALGPWDQRPVYKSHGYRFDPIRRCKPSVPDALLRELPEIFRDKPDSSYRMDPSYERTDPLANPQHVKLFKKFKTLRNARLLTTQGNKDLFSVALESKTVRLTPLGQFYWRLAHSKRI